jgi:hypothetical protein
MQTTLVAVAAALGLVHAVHGAIVADSVADFSGVQGANGWEYGYIAPGDGLGFHLMPGFGMHPGLPAPEQELAWFVEYHGDPILYPTPYTSLTAQGGHPNGGSQSLGVEQWTVRRWTAPFAATFTFSGLLGDYAADFGGGGDGVLATAISPSGSMWSFSTSQHTAEFSYSFDAALQAGEHIDFVVSPKLNEDTDSYIWTVQVVPNPGTAVIAVTACGWGLGRPSRRRLS